jgi:hypothetical protein
LDGRWEYGVARPENAWRERYNLALPDDVIVWACRSARMPVGLVQRRQGHVPSQSKRKTCSHDISLSLDGKLSNGRRKETGQFTYIELVDELLNGIFVASEVLGCRRHPRNGRRVIWANTGLLKRGSLKT